MVVPCREDAMKHGGGIPMPEEIRVVLPYPPTVNTYWRMVNGRMIISKAGRQYREAVVARAAFRGRVDGRLLVVIDAYPPDRRKRDLDNILKSLVDSLAHAGVYEDDSQIDKYVVERRDVVDGGRVEVYVGPYVRSV